jgi:hypothetical protein
MFKLLIDKINDLRQQIKNLQRSYSFLTEYNILRFIEDRYFYKDFYIQEYKISSDIIIYLKEYTVYKNSFDQQLFGITELFSKYVTIKDIQNDFKDIIEKQLARYLVENLLIDKYKYSKHNLLEYFEAEHKYSLYLCNDVYNIIKLQNSDTYYLFSTEHQTDINNLDIIKTDIKECIF